MGQNMFFIVLSGWVDPKQFSSNVLIFLLNMYSVRYYHYKNTIILIIISYFNKMIYVVLCIKNTLFATFNPFDRFLFS